MSTEMIQITISDYPGGMVNTVNGAITYRDWLIIEQRRFEQSGRIAEIRKRAGCIALWADRIAGDE